MWPIAPSEMEGKPGHRRETIPISQRAAKASCRNHPTSCSHLAKFTSYRSPERKFPTPVLGARRCGPSMAGRDSSSLPLVASTSLPAAPDTVSPHHYGNPTLPRCRGVFLKSGCEFAGWDLRHEEAEGHRGHGRTEEGSEATQGIIILHCCKPFISLSLRLAWLFFFV